MELTIKDLKDLFSEKESKKTGFEKYLNKNIFLRTVTHHYTGHVVEVDSMSMTLEKAAWICDDGRFHNAMKDSSNFNEVEPFVNPITINLYSILECTELEGELPRKQK